MVGIITVKDFITGSYNRARIAVFNGESYVDINYENSYSQYDIDIAKRSIVSKSQSSAENIDISYFDLMKLCDEYMSQLVANPYACCFKFKFNNDKPELRVLPANQGNFVLPDLYNFLHGNAVYFPLETYTFKMGNGSFRANLLEADVCCELMNYAIYELSKEAIKLFYHSGGTVYLNLAPLIKNRRLRSAIKEYLSAFDGVYQNTMSIYKRREKSITHATLPFPAHLIKPDVKMQDEDFCEEEFGFIINTIRASKFDSLDIIAEKFLDIDNRELVKNLFELIKDRDFVKIKDNLYDMISNYAENLVDYKYLPDKNYIKYLSVGDILTAQVSATHRMELSSRAELLRYTAANFEKRLNHLISWDGSAYAF